MKQILVIELLDGRRVIGKVDSDFEMVNHLEVEDPIMIIANETKDDRLSIGFLPWIPLCEGNPKFEKSSVVCYYSPVKNLETQYKQMTGGIITPPTSIIK